MKSLTIFLKVVVTCFYLSVCVATPVALSSSLQPNEKPGTLQIVDKVNINTASVDELSERLKGIGKAKAQAIVDFREIHGGFRHIDELIEVKGIGEAILAKNKGRLTL